MTLPTEDLMGHSPLIERWSDVDAWLLAEAWTLLRQHARPDTAAFVFHRGVTSVVIQTPSLFDEDAEVIATALCYMIHPLQPDQVLITVPGLYGLRHDDPSPLMTARAMLGERNGTWGHRVYPLPYDEPQPRTGAIALDVEEPWASRLPAIFGDAPPPSPELANVRDLSGEFTIAINPTGPLADIGDLMDVGERVDGS